MNMQLEIVVGAVCHMSLQEHDHDGYVVLDFLLVYDYVGKLLGNRSGILLTCWLTVELLIDYVARSLACHYVPEPVAGQ